MQIKTREQVLIDIIGKKVIGVVEAKEHTNHSWIGRPTYLIKYEDYWVKGEYVDAEFLPDDKTQKEIDEALND